MTDKLSDRVERLEGPDREIDGLIMQALNPERDFHEFEDCLGMRDLEDGMAFEMPKPYTASLDAAMSLLPEGCTWNLSVGRVAIVQVTDCTGGPTVAPPDFEATAATPAIALCAAALKARGL